MNKKDILQFFLLLVIYEVLVNFYQYMGLDPLHNSLRDRIESLKNEEEDEDDDDDGGTPVLANR